MIYHKPQGEQMKVIIKEQKTYNLEEVIANIRVIFTELNIFEKLKDKQTILLKPNLLAPYHPDKAVTTHPVVIEAVIIILKELNKDIAVGDSCGGSHKIQAVWDKTGVLDVCQRHNVRLLEFGKEGVVNIQTDLANFIFDKNVVEYDAIINIAKMKTHSLMLFTGAVKNLYGVIPGLYKTELHKHFIEPENFSFLLSAIYGLLKKNIILNIIDGIVGMDGAGPSGGNPFPFGILLASEKASAVDYVATELMGFEFKDMTYLIDSIKDDNLSISDIIIDDKWKGFKFKNVNLKTVLFRSRIVNKLPKFLSNWFQKLISFYPVMPKSCKLCLVCMQSCPVKVITLKEERLVFDKKDCIKCLCCHELCPDSEIKLKKHLLAKLFL